MMVKKRHDSSSEIPEVPFAAPAGTPAGVEVMSLAELRRRVPEQALARPQRPDFHHLLTLGAGRLRHVVDFEDCTLRPGCWLWVRPGQVHLWGDLTEAEGTLILFRQDVLDPATATAARVDDPHAPAVTVPVAADAEAVTLAADHLSREFGALGQLPLDVHVAALRHLLAVLLLRLSHLTTPLAGPAPEPDETYLRFRDAVERHFTVTRRVADYADMLGYSGRTLARASLAGAGLGAKEFIDRRVVLEAKRRLAHGDETAAQISDHLGFVTPSQFSKYFMQRTGSSPIDFRKAVRGRAAADASAD
ncbi:AraC family transcriptional regulator [Streptomyces griseorubiginosus]|uniref:helix-turn-helix domain-containing protein n=1 Tax=Streptomyces griseorubiginosus TaxID=67304 RepID=UPI002E7FDB0C|nr:AraC family transcriptional regulator [Streptomyces griseorubiginosus]WUB49625.1 AraC family transcriptional regulator [Streptomyces griseorubiginosus]WUB58154.1 AraC family transcriptional regulator [Streptomyces griseorubiginosus]